MVYLMIAIAMILLFANSYASVIVLRSQISERNQKIMQLAFVWLLPFAEAFLAVNLLKEKPRSYLFYPPSFGWSDLGINDGGAGSGHVGCSDSSID